jgi:hypothetical protein
MEDGAERRQRGQRDGVPRSRYKVVDALVAPREELSVKLLSRLRIERLAIPPERQVDIVLALDEV